MTHFQDNKRQSPGGIAAEEREREGNRIEEGKDRRCCTTVTNAASVSVSAAPQSSDRQKCDATVSYQRRATMIAGDADSGLATCSELPSCSEAYCQELAAAVAASRKPAPTLKQHYYPEGGWGWFVVFIAVVVQVLTHGLHMGIGVLLPEVGNRFPTASYTATVTAAILRQNSELALNSEQNAALCIADQSGERGGAWRRVCEN
ncbi:hypothetical protein LSTR_LSTR002485 [Laodelphax striatellus]|uniref:Uncharacterized protein n=1 Tax=Laodelphax striatellus TaxID=195883 RepID=A0A482X345_LAOST|nr:hypothetical protein LSTR_LSTR002485 [Laodelphax striatellus]